MENLTNMEPRMDAGEGFKPRALGASAPFRGALNDVRNDVTLERPNDVIFSHITPRTRRGQRHCPCRCAAARAPFRASFPDAQDHLAEQKVLHLLFKMVLLMQKDPVVILDKDIKIYLESLLLLS